MLIHRIAAAGLLLGTLPAAGAAPICVACSQPDAAYPCALAQDGRLERVADEPRAVEAVCLKVLKKAGQHGSCRVVRDDVTRCSGAVREVSAQEYLAALADSDGSTQTEGVIPGAARVATETLGKAGEAISGSAKSTWSCLSSLFTDCSSD